jgi:hypothetical protein
MMRGLLLVLFFVGAVSVYFEGQIYVKSNSKHKIITQALGQIQLLKCGEWPKVKIGFCCPGLEKFMLRDIIDPCEKECGMNKCCLSDCIGEASGLMQNGKFNKPTARNILNQTIGSDAHWLKVSFW